MKRIMVALILLLLLPLMVTAQVREWSGCYWITDKYAESGTDLYLVGYGWLGQPVHLDVSNLIYTQVQRGMTVNLWREWQWEEWQGYECHCIPSMPGRCLLPGGRWYLPMLK